jgi:hypothetical protein
VWVRLPPAAPIWDPYPKADAGALADKNPETLGAIKRRLYAGALAALHDHDANSLTGAGGD